MKAVIRSSGKELASIISVADSIFSRMKGLLGRNSFMPGEGLWLKPCKGIHTFGMQFAIDVIILDRENRVIDIISDLKPNRMTSLYGGAAAVIELPSNSAFASGLAVGDSVELIS